MSDHNKALASAFDGQAAQFEKAPVQSDPHALARLVDFARLPENSLLLDSGCGPGLVALAFLEAGHRVVGVDLSAEMVARARARCSKFGDRAQFVQGSVFDVSFPEPFDAAISRYVIHHLTDPLAFVKRQVELIGTEGIVVISDHTTDPDPKRQAWHQEIEQLRDHTHTRNLTPGELVDVLAQAGLEKIQAMEELFTLDFDEWFDRGTPTATKESVRGHLGSGQRCRGFDPTLSEHRAVALSCWRSIVRGIKPAV